jgi:sulfate adenylyltransferase subunit 2
MTERYRLSYLRQIEAESIFILREVAAEFENPVLLYSAGKDSSVMLRLAQKAFHPGPVPFPLLHVDTGYKFREMIEFRDRYPASVGCRLIVEQNEQAIADRTHPDQLGADKCCALLKTQALVDALARHDFDAAIGGARREEEKSRAKERVYSLRDEFGQWDPKNQRPELWNLYNGLINPGQSVRVFPLSNWTELDVWSYVCAERIPVVPLYFARRREVVRRGSTLIPVDAGVEIRPDEKAHSVLCRFRTLGCSPCTGAVESEADTVEKIVTEVRATRRSERAHRLIDFTCETSMEDKKKEGYF